VVVLVVKLYVCVGCILLGVIYFVMYCLIFGYECQLSLYVFIFICHICGYEWSKSQCLCIYFYDGGPVVCSFVLYSQ